MLLNAVKSSFILIKFFFTKLSLITHRDSDSLACLGHLDRKRGLRQAGMAESEVVIEDIFVKKLCKCKKPLTTQRLVYIDKVF